MNSVCTDDLIRRRGSYLVAVGPRLTINSLNRANVVFSQPKLVTVNTSFAANKQEKACSCCFCGLLFLVGHEAQETTIWDEEKNKPAVLRAHKECVEHEQARSR